MARLAHSFTVAVVLLLAGGTMSVCFAAETDGVEAESVERGAYLATASDCAACHTAPGGQPFAGGLPIASPVGTIFSTNITPSTSAGIGNYSEADFARAVRRGIRKDGDNLYPAMPYTSYRVLTDADVHDLYNYFQHGVAPVNVAPTRTSLPFPMNIRASMIAWNLLFLSSEGFVADPHQPADWNRGGYLVTGPAHCSTCHTPRGFLMQEQSGLNLAGSEVGPWFVPNITSDVASGIGSWTQQEIVQYLATGSLPPKARAAGSMGEAVEHSFQHLTPSDIAAIANYIRTIPAVHDASDSQPRFGYGTAGSMLGTLRGANEIRSGTGSSPTGAELFLSNCASCHSSYGQGSKDNYYPSIFHNSVTGSANPTNLIATILTALTARHPQAKPTCPGSVAIKPTPTSSTITRLSCSPITCSSNMGAWAHRSLKAMSPWCGKAALRRRWCGSQRSASPRQSLCSCCWARFWFSGPYASEERRDCVKPLGATAAAKKAPTSARAFYYLRFTGIKLAALSGRQPC
jgi:fructose 5-dehydrogenase cytochrome subunit